MKTVTVDMIKAQFPDAESTELVHRDENGTEEYRWPLVFIPSMGWAGLLRTNPDIVLWYKAESLKDAAARPEWWKEPRRRVPEPWQARPACIPEVWKQP